MRPTRPALKWPHLSDFHWFVRNSLALLFTAWIVFFFACGTTYAQGGVPLVTVATDQSPLQLSNQFGVPVATAINQAEDFTFIGDGNNGLFFRPFGATSASLLLQAGDEVPGLPAA